MNLKCHVKKFKFYIFCFWLILLVIIGAYILCGKKTETISISSGEKRELLAIIHEGTSNTCHWTISDAGQLTIGSGTLANYTNTGQAPWYQHQSQIKNVYVNPGVKTNTHCVGLFYGLSNCTTISMANLDTVTNSTSGLTHFFEGCTSLTSLTLPNNFVTSKVTNISHMFKDCKKITTIDVSKFVTTNVTNVDSLFMGCTKLTSITWGTFNTSKVTQFGNMFSSCNSLTAIGKAINTDSATNMDCMFYDCNLVTSINLSNFNTSKVTSMYKMFSYCGVTSLDLSTFNTSKVTNMQGMLANMGNCNSIKLSSNFRFKKNNTTLIQVFGAPAYYWKSGSTIKTSLQLENITGTVTGTWVRQCIINYYQGSTNLGQTAIDAGSNGTLTAYSGTAPTNWTFYGWSTSSTGVTRNYVNSASITNAPVSTTSSYIKLYAIFSRDLTIVYNGNGSDGGSTTNSTKTIYYNPNNSSTSTQSVTLSANGYTKSGYSFTGWNTAANGSGTNYSAGASYNPGLAYDASSFTKTLYANWSSNTYKVEYYQGNNTTTAGATKLGESTHTYDTAQNLSTYATLKTSSGKSEPQSWVFYGWSVNNGTTATTRTYTDGQSVNNLTTTNNGVIKIYAIFKRTIKFNSGLNCATTSSVEQRYNPYKTTGSITAVSAPAPSMTGLSDSTLGWAPIGYRANKTAANRTYAVTTSATNITPAYNVYDVTNATATTVNLYGVYSRTVTLYHGLNKAQNSTPTQYMNTSGNAVSQILAPAPSTTGLSNYSWNAVGYRTDGGLEIGD